MLCLRLRERSSSHHGRHCNTRPEICWKAVQAQRRVVRICPSLAFGKSSYAVCKIVSCDYHHLTNLDIVRSPNESESF